MTPDVNDLIVQVLVRDRLQIRMPDSTSYSSKLSDLFDNYETKILNSETCLEAGFTVSNVVYTPLIVTVDTRISFLLYL